MKSIKISLVALALVTLMTTAFTTNSKRAIAIGDFVAVTVNTTSVTSTTQLATTPLAGSSIDLTRCTRAAAANICAVKIVTVAPLAVENYVFFGKYQ